MSSGLKDATYVFTSRFFNIATGIGMQSCLAWFLGPEDRGSYAVCLMYASILNLIFLFGCDMAGVYFVSKNVFGISKGFTYSLIYGSVGSLVAMLVGIAVLQFPLEFFNKANLESFYLGLLIIPTMLFSLVLPNLYTAISKFKWFAILTALYSAFQLLFTICFVRLFNWGVNGALLAVVAAGVTTSVLSTGSLYYYGARLVRPLYSDLRKMFDYGIRFYFGKIGNAANMQVGVIILAMFVAREEVGLFAVASQLTARFLMIPTTIVSVLMPRVANNVTDKKELVAQCSRITAAICSILLILLALFSKPLVIILFSPAFLDSVLLIQICALGIGFRCVTKVFESYLLGKGHPGIVSMCIATGLVINFSTLPFFLKHMGLGGAAWSLTLSYFFGAVLLLYYFTKHSQLTFSQSMICKKEDYTLLSNYIGMFFNKIFKKQNAV